MCIRDRRVVVTSATTARLLAADYGVPADHIVVACPGSDSAPAAHGSNDGIVRLLAIGAMVPRKGFDVLIAALATLADLPWHLTIAGDRRRDPDAAAQLDADIVRCKLSHRVAVLGAVSRERIAELYAGADLFTLASRFEGYGMAFSEAIAHGLPVIGTTAGAIPETVPAGAGVLVAPDDAASLVRIFDCSAQRHRMTGFSADWLALREPHDARARNPAVLNAVVASLAGYPSIRIVDLACGTGSTLRVLAPQFPTGQHWRLVDNDLSLLARAAAMVQPAGGTFTTAPLDLNRDLEAALDGPIDLLTTSA